MLRCSSSASQPAANGSDTPSTSSATVTLAGKPIWKTLSCGTTRDTTPNAASVRITASATGAASSSAATNTPENACCTPATIEPSAGASTSGTSEYVRYRPLMTHASPLTAMNTATATNA